MATGATGPGRMSRLVAIMYPTRPPQFAVHHSAAHPVTSTTVPPGTTATTPKVVPGPCRRLVLEKTRAGPAAAAATERPSSNVASPTDPHSVRTDVMNISPP